MALHGPLNAMICFGPSSSASSVQTKSRDIASPRIRGQRYLPIGCGVLVLNPSRVTSTVCPYRAICTKFLRRNLVAPHFLDFLESRGACLKASHQGHTGTPSPYISSTPWLASTCSQTIIPKAHSLISSHRKCRTDYHSHCLLSHSLLRCFRLELRSSDFRSRHSSRDV
jgi:hypothetical protein